MPAAELLTRDTRRRIFIALAGILSLFFVALAIVSATGDLPHLQVRLSWGWLALAGMCFLLFQPLIVEVWRRVVREAGGELSVPRAHAIYNVSLLTRYVPTQVLMAVTRIELAQREGVARSISIAGFAYEFALSVGTAFALSVSFVIGLDSLQGHWWRYLSLLAPVAVLLALHPRVIDTLETKVAARFNVASAHVTIPLRRLVPYLVLYVIIWLIAGLGVYAVARGIHDVDAPGITAISSYAIGFAAAAVAFVLPAGLGARDVATATALSTAMPFSVALATAIVVRLVQTAIELLLVGVTTVWARRADAAAKRAC